MKRANKDNYLKTQLEFMIADYQGSNCLFLFFEAGIFCVALTVLELDL